MPKDLILLLFLQIYFTNVTLEYQLNFFNPYKPSIQFVGHQQTVQKQTRHRKMQSDQVLHCLTTDGIFKILIKLKNTIQQP